MPVGVIANEGLGTARSVWQATDKVPVMIVDGCDDEIIDVYLVRKWEGSMTNDDDSDLVMANDDDDCKEPPKDCKEPPKKKFGRQDLSPRRWFKKYGFVQRPDLQPHD